MRKFSYITAGFALIAAILACNLPSGQQTPAAVMTAAALTVQAQLTPSPSSGATVTFTPPPASTSTEPPTVPPANSPTPVCDLAQFVKDVNVPDGTKFDPNEHFTKTWRLKNIGACTWSGYNLIFDSGDLMGGTSPIAISTVNSGQEVDLSVDLTAPGSEGNYRGYWRIRNTSGVLVPVSNGYQGKSFYVDIKVKNSGGGGGSSHTVTLTTISGEDGQVRSDGTVLSPPNTGDLASNDTAEAFLSFDISGIPSNATITKVTTNFSDYDTLGNPFSLGNDGCVRAYIQNYGSLDAGDFFAGDPTGAVARWCSTGELDNTAMEQTDMVSALQSELGAPRFKLRVQFRPPTTNNNGVADMIRFGAVKLKITYTTP